MAATIAKQLNNTMKTSKILSCVTPDAIKNAQSLRHSKNKLDYNKLQKLFEENFFEAKNFEDTRVDILTFDWESLSRDRNWWWQLQAFPFLNWFVNSWELQNNEERKKYFLSCINIIKNWIERAKNNSKSPLVWHDHASAFRLRNLTNWLVFTYAQGLNIAEITGAEPIGSLIVEHLDWLQNDSNYSKHTNHGFDQAIISLTTSLMFDDEEFNAYRNKNRERLKEEVNFAFTGEGVHKENSPGYQKVMLARLKQVKALDKFNEQALSDFASKYIDKASKFLEAITLPNGYLPMLGDTQGDDMGIKSEIKEQSNFTIYNYSKSGYVIAKGKSQKTGEVFFLMKNSHDSNYHRHDDDLMVYLWVNGEVILGDGGLYLHDEKNPIRKFLRSHLAHSTLFTKGKAIRDKANLQAPPQMEYDLSQRKVKAKSSMFGKELTREVDLSEIELGKIYIKDDSLDDSPIFTNFYFGNNPKITSLTQRKVQVCTPLTSCEINTTAKFNGMYNGGDPMTVEASYISKKYNYSESNIRAVFSAVTPIVSSIEFEQRSNEIG